MNAPRKPESRSGNLLPLLLALSVIVLSIMVVQVKHRDRTLTTQLDKQRQERERLELEWAQLQLEEATLAQHGRVDALARSQFNMADPTDYRIVDSATGKVEVRP